MNMQEGQQIVRAFIFVLGQNISDELIEELIRNVISLQAENEQISAPKAIDWSSALKALTDYELENDNSSSIKLQTLDCFVNHT